MEKRMPLIELTERGIYCSVGDFYIDPSRPVKKAIITHAHSDHARPGSKAYLCAESCRELLALRLQKGATIETVRFGDEIQIGDATVSLHPAGHILGSSQIRIEHGGNVCVVSGDYKLQQDHSCEAFEPVRCDHFVTEATFALPLYRWEAEENVFKDIHTWWQRNQQESRTSIIYAYALGKTQRILAGLHSDIGPIGLHGSALQFLAPYKNQGVKFPSVLSANATNADALRSKGLVLAPPSAMKESWLKKFGACSEAFASGWMQVRGKRRMRALDRGFVISDHVDWDGILETIEATGAQHITATHGDSAVLVRYLQEKGYRADALEITDRAPTSSFSNEADSV